MNQSNTLMCYVLVVGLALAGGCSKRESEPASEPKNPKTPAKSTAPKPTANAPKAMQSGSTKSAAGQSKSAGNPQKASALEKAYLDAKDSGQKTDLVYRLGDIGSSEAIVAMGRIFEKETDADLKENILTALWVIDGHDKEKIPIYVSAIKPNQPEDVRKEAIDGLGDLEVVDAIPVLQTLLNDPNEEIRDAATEAIDTVQSSLSED